MRIAVQYSGLLRTMKKCYKNIFKLLKEHDVDVFLSIWDIPGTSLTSSGKLKDVKNIFPELHYENINEELIRKEFPDINFKVIDIESIELADNFMEKFHHINITFLAFIPQHYKINRCNNLRLKYQKENNINYDWYIRIRPDCTITKFPDLNNYKEPTLLVNKYVDEHNKISFEKHMYTQYGQKNLATPVNGMFWMSNNENVMKLTCNVYNKINKYWHSVVPGEPMFGNYLVGEELKKYGKLYDFNIIVLRSHGYCQVMGRHKNGFSPIAPFYTEFTEFTKS